MILDMQLGGAVLMLFMKLNVINSSLGQTSMKAADRICIYIHFLTIWLEFLITYDVELLDGSLQCNVMESSDQDLVVQR